MKVSIIIPVLNEQKAIQKLLPSLAWARREGHEIIIVDGGSHDDTAQSAEAYSDFVIFSPRSRSIQMNMGASAATGDIFLFLHVDTVLPHDSFHELLSVLQRKSHVWGRFNVRLSGKHFLLRIVEFMMNARSRLTGIATGDQAIFVSKELFQSIGGFRNIAIMEDIEISRRLRKVFRPICLSQTVLTSSRRWEQSGILRTIILMWRLRISYWLGADPENLVKQYYR